MADIRITDPYLMEQYHEDFKVQYRIDIEDAIDFYDYHDAPQVVEIFLSLKELDELIAKLMAKSKLGKELKLNE